MTLQNKNRNYQIEVVPREGLVTVGFLTRLRELECVYDNPQTTNRDLSGKQSHRVGTYYLFPDKTTARNFELEIKKANIGDVSFMQLPDEQG